MWPSSSKASSATLRWPLAWVSVSAASERVDTQHTGAPSTPRRNEHRALLRVAHELHSEAAAHFRRHHAKPVFFDAQRRGDQRAHQVHALALGIEAIGAALGVVASDRGAGLDRRSPYPVVRALDPDHVGGPRERRRRRLGVAELAHHRDFVALARVQHRGQGLVVDLQPLRCVGGSLDRCRHHHRHGVADKACLIDRQHVPGRSVEGCAVAALDGACAGERPHALRQEVTTVEDGLHALGVARGPSVEMRDPSVRVGRAREHRMQAIRGVEVLDEATRSPQQALVLEAVHAGPRPAGWRVHSTPAGSGAPNPRASASPALPLPAEAPIPARTTWTEMESRFHGILALASPGVLHSTVQRWVDP